MIRDLQIFTTPITSTPDDYSGRFATLPKSLVNNNGERVTTREQWENVRRAEILELFKENVYGRNLIERPDSLKFSVEEKDEMMDGTAIRKQVAITFEGPGGEGQINLLLFVPKNISKPAPVFLLINNRSKNNTDPDRSTISPFWPAEEIVARGYAAAVFHYGDAARDNKDEYLKGGVFKVFEDSAAQRPTDAWGTVGAWAWAASRAMDYIETDEDLDSKRVAVIGHSRGGKTALWCGAQDERFAMVISNESGSTGAAISRGKIGETIFNINDKFPHWFCDNYKKFDHKEEELPVDQHMLLALVAPRPVYIGSAIEDTWSDPQSEFLACVYAEDVYKLYGLKGLGINQFPDLDSPAATGSIAYQVRSGAHDLTLYDWSCYLDYADRLMVTPK